jgi:hypothetical protein
MIDQSEGTSNAPSRAMSRISERSPVAGSGAGGLVSRARWSSMEPEVGIEPTTYRLQDDTSTSTMATTCNNRHPGGHMSQSNPLLSTRLRATFGATTRRDVTPPPSSTAAAGPGCASPGLRGVDQSTVHRWAQPYLSNELGPAASAE